MNSRVKAGLCGLETAEAMKACDDRSGVATVVRDWILEAGESEVDLRLALVQHARQEYTRVRTAGAVALKLQGVYVFCVGEPDKPEPEKKGRGVRRRAR